MSRGWLNSRRVFSFRANSPMCHLLLWSFHAFLQSQIKSHSVASQRFFLLFIKHHFARKLSKLSRGTSARFTQLRHFFEKANQTVLSNNYFTKFIYCIKIQLTTRSISSSLNRMRKQLPQHNSYMLKIY